MEATIRLSAFRRLGLAVALLWAVQLLTVHDAEAGDQSADVTIYVVTNPSHTDLVVPRSAFVGAPRLIKSAVDSVPGGPWIVIGWGPYWFGRSTPGGPYHSPPVLMANGAWTLIVPQLRSRIRLAALAEPGPPPRETYNSLFSLQMSVAGLGRAIERIDASFKRGRDGGPIQADLAGAAPGVMIYQSNEIYHVTHECNHWVAEVLHAGGLNTTSLLDLTPGLLQLDLRVAGATPGPPAGLSPLERSIGRSAPAQSASSQETEASTAPLESDGQGARDASERTQELIPPLQ